MNHKGISIIVAVGRDNIIGKNGDLAFHIGADLRRFKEITMGKPVIMGRKTYESLPKGALPGRRNIVITRNPSWTAPNTEKAVGLEDALNLTAENEERMIIGGGEIYRQAMEVADKIYLTEIDASLDNADTFFPQIDLNTWQTESQTDWTIDGSSGLKYRFVCLSRNN